jgi:hypothetical protein
VFQTSDVVEPAPDLWNRVVHSIEEDRRHRRRVVRTVSAICAALAAFVIVGALSVQDGRFGRFLDRPTMEVLEVLALTTLLLALGPAIRRFGRGYASDMWPAGDAMPRALLRLLDVAFYLVGAGYILLSTELEFTDGLLAGRLADQLGEAAVRIGGLLLLFGVLHATTLFVLPIVALVHNSTRTGHRLPRWVVLVLIAVGLAALMVLQAAVGIGLSGSE